MLTPARGGEELVWRLHQDIGVAQAAAAHTAAMQSEDVAEWADLQDAEAAERWRPEVFADLPVGAGEIARGVAFAALERKHAVAFLREPQGGDAAAEAGANDDVIV